MARSQISSDCTRSALCKGSQTLPSTAYLMARQMLWRHLLIHRAEVRPGQRSATCWSATASSPNCPHNEYGCCICLSVAILSVGEIVWTRRTAGDLYVSHTFHQSPLGPALSMRKVTHTLLLAQHLLLARFHLSSWSVSSRNSCLRRSTGSRGSPRSIKDRARGRTLMLFDNIPAHGRTPIPRRQRPAFAGCLISISNYLLNVHYHRLTLPTSSPPIQYARLVLSLIHI